MAVRARILVLTEDSGKQAQPTIQKILKEMLKLLVDGVDLSPAWIQIDPLPDNDLALQATRSNRWEERPPTRETIILLEHIATRLREQGGFVVFHFDTDRVWDERNSSKRPQNFDKFIRDGVRRSLRGEAPLPVNQRPRLTLTAEEIESALGRLFVLSPCYSIESWLYQATKEVLWHCQGVHDSEEHVQLLQSWSAQRALLDNVSRPKDDALPCVSDRYNSEFAKVFPAEEVWLAERSFFESVEQLRSCSALVEALSY